MPIYEFRCDACRATFDALVEAGADAAACKHCGAGSVRRVLSPPAPSPHLVRTPRETRKQERANAKLREGAKARFKAARARGRAQGKGPAGGKR